MNDRKLFTKKVISVTVLITSFFLLVGSIVGIYGLFATSAYTLSENEYRRSIMRRTLGQDMWQIRRELENAYYILEGESDGELAVNKEMFTESVLSRYADSNLIINITSNGEELLVLNKGEKELIRTLVNYDIYGDKEIKYEISILQTLKNDDKYRQISNLAIFAYQVKYVVYLGFLVSLIGVVVSLMYLRRNKKEMKLNIFDKIPLEIIIIGYLMLYGDTMSFYQYRSLNTLFSLFLLIIGFYAIISSMNRRYHNKVLLKNTLLFQVYELFRYILKDISILLKVLLIMGSIFIIDVWIVYIYRYDVIFMLFIFLIKYTVIGYLVLRHFVDLKNIRIGTELIALGDLDFKFDTASYNEPGKSIARNLNQISNAASIAVDKQMKSERMKTELITNVSHDIKTPITSIINYVNLLSKTDKPDEIREYTEVLSRQSTRLKNLIENLIEASKLSTGNIMIKKEQTDISVLINQVIGEYSDKFEERNLSLVFNSMNKELMILGDGQQLSRLFDNLLNNAYQYSHENTRIYIDLTEDKSYYIVTIKNVSKQALNVDADELIERFIRGDSSRNTEGSGLGLSIAKSIVDLHFGEFMIQIDGDLFKVVVKLVKEG